MGASRSDSSESSDLSDFDLECLGVCGGFIVSVRAQGTTKGRTLVATISTSLSDESDESLDGAGGVLCARFAFSEG